MSEFKREERFIVVKRKHLSRNEEIDMRAWLQQNEIPTCECVVVESDWPEYETVWRMIEARVTGATTPPAAPLAAGQGEEGRETVLVIGYAFKKQAEFMPRRLVTDWLYQGDAAVDGIEIPEPLMTVAQHERILAAKDAEIERLTDELSDCDFRRRVAIQNAQDAQPARQVSGGELQAKVTEFIERARRIAKLNREAASELEEHDVDEAAACDHMADINTEAADLLEELARAARAPAADAWPKLEKKAQVGAGIFSAGLSSRLVVEAAYRQHEYSQQPEVEAERLEKFRSLFTPAAVVMQESSPCDVMDSTGNAEVDRIIGRLMSADPDFNDCTDAAMLLRRLVIEEINGPSGYSTWKDAATAERIKRVAMKPREEIVSLARDGIDMYPGPNMNERKLCDEIIRLDAAYSSDSKLDEVARLNRRAIPLELLKKLAHCTDPDCCIAHARGELRALLGKEGGG